MLLKIVGLPIGNVEDISLRALKILSETSFIVCEDSRMFSNLWSKLKQLNLVGNFSGRVKFVNDYNEYKVLPKLLEEMDLLEEAVLVSDAGMPLISDPGYKLVSEGIKRGWSIGVIPGPTAESSALAVSGLPTDKYMFLGFLPKTGGKRKTLLERIRQMQELQKFTIVIYESAVRMPKLLLEIGDIFGGYCLLSVSVDMTKVSEKVHRGSVDDISKLFVGKKMKGEVTLVLSLN